MKKRELIKLILLISIILVLFLIFLIFSNRSYDYSKKYRVDNVEITESFNKLNGYYLFDYKYKNKNFKIIVFNKFLKKTNLIDSIDVTESDANICLSSKSNYLKLYDVCNGKNGYYVKSNKKIKSLNEKYKNISINYLTDNIFILWNYSGFYYINGKDREFINIFDDDVYDNSLMTIKDEYILIPDYDKEYSFNKYIIYDVKKKKNDYMKLKSSISFDSYVMGSFDKSVYVFDKKNKKEYEIVPYKGKIRSVSPKILENGLWVKKNAKNLSKRQFLFTYDEIVKYKLIGDKLYREFNNYKEYVSDSVNKIIKYNKDEVFYLKDYSLYYYSPKSGEIKLITNFEWNFNSENMIFIY